MKLTPEAREAVNLAIAEAHKDGRPTREIATRVVSAIRDMEPSGLPWVDTYMDELAILGAQKMCADWRRRQQSKARTAKGSQSPCPAFVGANRKGAAVQLGFAGLTVSELRDHRARLIAQRNTLSVEIQYLADLIDVMDAEGLETAGEAKARLAERAA